MRKITEFYNLTSDLLSHPIVLNMANLEHHSKTSDLLEHLVHTSYISFLIADFLKLDKKCIARAALLHDFRTSNDVNIRGWFVHSQFSATSAQKYFNISNHEYEIIKSHMWPLNLSLIPKSKEAVIVNLADTYCATIEMLNLYSKTKTSKLVLNIIKKAKLEKLA